MWLWPTAPGGHSHVKTYRDFTKNPKGLDGNLQINSFSLNHLFQLQKHLPNWRQHFKIGFKNSVFFFFWKSPEFRSVWTIWLLEECLERLKTSNDSIRRNSFKFTVKIDKNWFSDRIPTIADADIEVLSLFIHYLISIWTTSKIWTKSYGPNCTKFWAFRQKKKKRKEKRNEKKKKKKKKKINHFWQSVDAILEEVSYFSNCNNCLLQNYWF